MVPFSKMHGAGNDYIYVDCLSRALSDPGTFSRAVSHRRFGIGSDGLVLILPSAQGDFRMRIFNADGSEAMMCGNAIRCVGKFVYDKGLTGKRQLTIETASGLKRLELRVRDGKVYAVLVDMGKAVLRPRDIPMDADGEDFVDRPVTVNGVERRLTCVSMGNPHAVLFVDDPAVLDLERMGPHFERHPLFPNRVNTEFVRVFLPEHIRMRVWERGSGETLACGTGACASVVACVLNGKCKRDARVRVELRGGELYITWRSDGTVLMEGPATHVFDGVIDENHKVQEERF